MSLFDKRCTDFFFQNNTKFQTILLVSIVSKLFRKLTSQVLETQFYCSNSSITKSISMKIHVKIESVRLEFHKNTKTKKQRKIKQRDQTKKPYKKQRDQTKEIFLTKPKPRRQKNNKLERSKPGGGGGD